MLIAKGISKKYIYKEKKLNFFKKETISKDAVNEIDLKIEEGKIVGLLGVNGAGKTTTIKMLAGILTPDSGTIFVNDEKLVATDRKIKNKLSLISGGERNLYWRLTAKENLEYFGALYNIDKNILKRRIAETLEFAGLTQNADTPVERFSKGMKQRLQIARGLLNDPQYIFLDEPTLGLDINFARKIREYIRQLATKENKGILLTTHYIREAEELCDYIYIIDKGQIILQGTPDIIRNSFVMRNEAQITFDKDTIKDNLEIDGLFRSLSVDYKIVDETRIDVIFDNISIGKIIAALESINIDIKQVKLNEISLEDSFLAAINGGKKNEAVC